MEEQIKPKKSIEIWGILKQSLLLYKENFFLFIGIAFLGNASWFLYTFLMSLLETAYPWVSFIIISLSFLISFWASLALIIAVSKRYLNNSITLKECFIKTEGRYWKFVGISMLYYLIWGIGLLLLLIPGIYWWTIFSLAIVIVVLERRTDIGPLKMSRELIKESFWKVFSLMLILLALSLPSYFIYKFPQISENLAMILGNIFFIFYASFSPVAMVVLYYRLKEKKAAQLPLEPAIPIKYSKGWLTCLGAIGLAISILILSTFWMLGLIKFFRTERGSQVSEFIKGIISSKITFPGGVTLERPKGWLVGMTQRPRTKYYLTRFGNNKIIHLELWYIPLKDLNVLKSQLALDNEVIRNKILERTIKESKMMGNEFKGYEPQALKIIKLGNRSWAEYILKKSSKMRLATISKHIYTIFDDYILIVSYFYFSFEEPKDLRFEEELLKEENEIKNIIASFHFPKD